MGKALTSASNPGEPGDPWANTGGDQRQNAESLQRGRVKGGGGDAKTRPAHGAEFLQDEKTAGACGPLGRGGRREVRGAHGAHAAGGRAGPGRSGSPSPRTASLGTLQHHSRRCPGAGHRHGSIPRFSARIPRVPCCWHRTVSRLAGWVPTQPPWRGSHCPLGLPALPPDDLQPGCCLSHTRPPAHCVWAQPASPAPAPSWQEPAAAPRPDPPNPRWRLTCSRNISRHFGSINSSGSGASLSPERGGLQPL